MTEKHIIAMDKGFEQYIDSEEYDRAEDKLLNIARMAYEAGYQAGVFSGQ